ncbi:MAG: Diaminopimelate decarboxylase [Myxococcaceae bacterium]|nr:Diaminopimelate decarboxylase [Myxococcaceae bacterium]
MSRDGSLVSRLLQGIGSNEGPLSVGGLAADELATTFGTPLYAFDAEALRHNFGAVRDRLGPRVEILFALKANPNAAVASTLRQAGAGGEVASAGEILIALHAGFRPDQLQFAGPGKHGADFELAVKHGLGAINLESTAEYEALARVATAHGVKVPVAVRVNPKASLAGSKMAMGGGSKKFGVDSDRVAALVTRIVSEGICELRGLHLYAGTQSFDAAGWVSNARGLRDFANALETEAGIAIHTLNFGGGFGVALYEGDHTLDLAALGQGLQQVIEEDQRPARRYFVELGRYLTANAGVYITRILYVKESGEKKHLIVDGGMHHHAAACGVGALIRRPYPMVLSRAPRADGGDKFAIGGPLCTPADELAAGVDLPPDVGAGDLLCVLASGAYGLTFSSVMFLGHPTPAEVLVDKGRAALVRRAGRVEDALRDQLLPES